MLRSPAKSRPDKWTSPSPLRPARSQGPSHSAAPWRLGGLKAVAPGCSPVSEAGAQFCPLRVYLANALPVHLHTSHLHHECDWSGGLILFKIFLAGLHDFTVSVYGLSHFEDPVKASEATQNPSDLLTRRGKIHKGILGSREVGGSAGRMISLRPSALLCKMCLMGPASWGVWRAWWGEMGEGPGAALGAQWVFRAQGHS